MPARRVLILAATTGYQTRVFQETARRIGYAPVLATDRCHHLEDPWGDHAVPVRFHETEASIEMLRTLPGPPPDGLVAVGDAPCELASLVARRLGLRYHSPDAVALCRDKFRMRERLREAGLLVPQYCRVALHTDPAEAMRAAMFPCVLKPLGLSGSRGVIRADSEAEFHTAFHRIARLLDHPDIRRLHQDRDRFLLIESFVPGQEFALEGLVTGGSLRTLALFDKPDPLDGPFFEETLYVTPSRESAEIRQAIEAAAQQAVTALGLTDGPVHAEMRVNAQGVWMLEAAPRPIGGLCATAVPRRDGMSLEELLLRAACDEELGPLTPEPGASGVMMIPVPSSGIYRGVSGVEEAESVAGITQVIITAREGDRIRQLPEGASYPGFLFARGETADQVEAALREAHQRLRFEIVGELPALSPAVTPAGSGPGRGN